MTKHGIVTDKDDMLFDEIINRLENDSFDNIIKAHLDCGSPIYSGSDEFPGKAIKTYPNGQREVVFFDNLGNEIVEKVLP